MSASAGGSRNPVRRAAAWAAARVPAFVDAYRYLRNPGWARRIRRDLAETRRQGEFLRAMPSGTGGSVLIALYRDDIYDLKTACLFAASLRGEGLEPVVAVRNRRQHRMAKYAAALGVRRVVFVDTLQLSSHDVTEVADAERSLLAGPIDFDTINGWQFRDFPAGTHVLSTLIRITFDGAPDFSVDHNRQAIESILHDVLINYLRAERLIVDVEPMLILVEEASYSTNGPLVDVGVARGIDVVQTVPTWRDDAFMSKRLTPETRRVNPRSVAPETLDALEASEPWTPALERELMTDFDRRYGGAWTLGAQFQPDTQSRTGAEIASELQLDPGRRTAVIFAHVLWDASLFYGVDLFENYTDWLVQSVRAATENDRVNWIVKAHPSNVFRRAHGDVSGESAEVVLVRRQFPRLPDHVRLLLPETRISTHSLYEFADFGLTVRGTPGVEMACFGKPVLTAGTGTYAGLGFTYDSSARAEYLERVARIHEYGPLPAEMTARAKWHAYALFLRRPWIPQSFTSRFDFPEQGWHPLDRNVEIRAHTAADLRDDADLSAWALWAAGTRSVDFVPPAPSDVAAGSGAGRG